MLIAGIAVGAALVALVAVFVLHRRNQTKTAPSQAGSDGKGLYTNPMTDFTIAVEDDDDADDDADERLAVDAVPELADPATKESSNLDKNRGSFFARFSRKKSNKVKLPEAESNIERVPSRRGLAPVHGSLQETGVDGKDMSLRRHMTQLGVATVEQRKEALELMRTRVVTRKTWEYVSSGRHDWWHPVMRRSQADSVLDGKASGTFLVYGRRPLMLAVRTSKSVVHHEIVDDETSGYRLKVGSQPQPWVEDLAALVAYYQEPRDIGFVLLDVDSNDIHFNVPSQDARLTGEDIGLEQPQYEDEDLNRLDHTIANRLSHAIEPPMDDEVVRVDPAIVRKTSRRTRESVENFTPLLLRDFE
jgi:hypothetical protein